MTPAEENALVEQSLIESTVQSDANVRFTLGDAIRLAIRAAYAKGREDAAKACESLCADYYDHAKGPYMDCAAAIAEGKK